MCGPILRRTCHDKYDRKAQDEDQANLKKVLNTGIGTGNSSILISHNTYEINPCGAKLQTPVHMTNFLRSLCCKSQGTPAVMA